MDSINDRGGKGEAFAGMCHEGEQYKCLASSQFLLCCVLKR